MRVCMVGYTFYESDNRVRRYAESLANRGDSVEVVALRRDGVPAIDTINGVKVFRIQGRQINEKSKWAYVARLCSFLLRSCVFITRAHLREPYQLIHVHSVPDFEVFATFFPKWTGAKVILDIHDIVPEFYASKFDVPRDSLAVKSLIAVERFSAGFADHVIAANHLWEERLIKRSVQPSKCTTMLNFPDTRIFCRQGRVRTDPKFVMLYPGTLSYHQGLDIALRAFSLIRDEIPQAEFHIYGKGDQQGPLRDLVVNLGLQDRVFIRDMAPLEQVPRLMENADLGVVPKRKDGFGNEAFSTKIFEFMSLGVPVVVPDTAIDRHYFNDRVVRFFHANDPQDLAKAMLELRRRPDLRQTLARNAEHFVRKYRWDANETRYLDLVDSLVRKESSGAHRN